jgi:hypothetical protein
VHLYCLIALVAPVRLAFWPVPVCTRQLKPGKALH